MIWKQALAQSFYCELWRIFDNTTRRLILILFLQFLHMVVRISNINFIFDWRCFFTCIVRFISSVTRLCLLYFTIICWYNCRIHIVNLLFSISNRKSETFLVALNCFLNCVYIGILKHGKLLNKVNPVAMINLVIFTSIAIGGKSFSSFYKN